IGDVERGLDEARRDALREPPTGARRWIWRAAHPRPWEDRVVVAARAHGLRPELLWAVMRQESGYDPDAVSYADAIGLLQLLPRIARQLGDELGVHVRREMLFDPTWNVRLGAVHVAGAVRALDGRVPLALAAYNAGVHRVRRWLDERGDMPLDLFVERIPFTQTRNYVRRVTTHYARYLYLADPDAGWPLDLLEHPG
ncbi:MAG: lytic transglycosylase domain-containing protein, partial [Polyangiales bacterium]